MKIRGETLLEANPWSSYSFVTLRSSSFLRNFVDDPLAYLGGMITPESMVVVEIGVRVVD